MNTIARTLLGGGLGFGSYLITVRIYRRMFGDKHWDLFPCLMVVGQTAFGMGIGYAWGSIPK